MKKGESIWINTTSKTDYLPLDKSIETDIVVVGGGLAGMLVAYFLKEEGREVVVFEKGRIGRGITKNTTAFISSIHDVRYYERIKKDGYLNAKLFLEANQNAILEYEKLSHKFDFDFEMLPAILYSTSSEKVINDEIKALKRLGENPHFKKDIELPIPIKGALELDNQAQMNPLKLINELGKMVKVYELSKVTSIKNNSLIVNGHTVKANKIIVTTHFPFINRWGLYFLKMYQKRSFVVAIKNNYPLKALYTNHDANDFYYRSYDDYLIIGGNDQRTGTIKHPYDTIMHHIEKYYPDSQVEYKWANQDCVTLDDLPYIGRYSKLHSNIYVITGFNLWGMTQSMIAGKIITDMIMKRKNNYQILFNPHRNIFKKQLWINALTYIKNLFTFKKKCSHLGSALVYNEEEGTWDCPCHGSRFNQDGNIIDNPATTPIKVQSNKTQTYSMNDKQMKQNE